MNRKQFEDEVEEFCRLWLCDYIDDYHGDYNECDDDVQACVSIEAAGNRSYALTLIIHPDKAGEIAIRTSEDGYVEADGEGLYLWLWLESMRQEDALLNKAGIMRMGDKSVKATYFLNGTDSKYIDVDKWMQKRKRDAHTLACLQPGNSKG